MIRRMLLDDGYVAVGIGETEGTRFFWMPFQGPYSVKGVADFIICDAGRFVAIEAKADTDQTEHQKDFELLTQSAGGIYCLVRSEKDMIKFLECMEWTRKSLSLPKS